MNLLTKIRNLKNFNYFTRENLEIIADSLSITNFKENKSSYVLYWTIGSFTIVFSIWALFASVDQVVRATGVVAPTSKVHIIQTLNEGVIEKINVKMSDEVEKGQLLFHVNYEVSKNQFDLAKAVRDAQERKVKLIEDLVKKGSEAEMRLLDERLTLYNVEDNFQKAEQNLKFSKVLSPVKGVISGVDIINIDQVVAAGEQIASIVPYNDTLQVEALVNPKDIAYVIPGLKARLAFSAYDMAIFGQFEGKVIKVAPNTTKEAPDQPDMYKTIIEINLDSVKKEKKIVLQSGMIVDVSIIGQERTVASYIINPITKLSKTALRD